MSRTSPGTSGTPTRARARRRCRARFHSPTFFSTPARPPWRSLAGPSCCVAAHQARPVRAEHTHDYPPSHSNTESPPNHHPITTQSLTTETPPLRDRCDAKGPSEKFILPAAAGQGVFDMVNTIPFFKKCHCAGPSHLVALTGAHTLGHAHSRYVPCFVPWYYSYPPKVPLYSFIQFKSISNLIFRSRHVGDSCVANSLPNTENARNLDTTPDVFDNTYWKHVTRAKCPKRRKHADRYDKCTAPYLTGESPFYVL